MEAAKKQRSSSSSTLEVILSSLLPTIYPSLSIICMRFMHKCLYWTYLFIQCAPLATLLATTTQFMSYESLRHTKWF